jgi:lipoprotein-anchoring transpeptidase ErfK/SrfK
MRAPITLRPAGMTPLRTRMRSFAPASNGSVRASLVLALSVVIVASGCGSHGGRKLSEGSTQRAVAAPVPRALVVPRPRPAPRPVSRPPDCRGGSTPLGSSRSAYAVVVRRDAAVRARPGGSRLVARVGRLDLNRQPTVLGAVAVRSGRGCRPSWYRVQLPVLPNGTTGWIAAAAVRSFRVSSRVVVSLSARRLRLYREGRLVLEVPVAVGSSDTPTPLGRYFVNERWSLTTADGPFGPNVLGISAHSPTLARVWAQQGPIGIHGTDEPSSIGQAASHGCIRVNNTVMKRLFRLAPLGTPVVIEA